MASATTRPRQEIRAPTIIRHPSKARITFTCMTCFREVTGWEYLVGYDPFNKISECGECWTTPRMPPMKPIGMGVILG